MTEFEKRRIDEYRKQGLGYIKISQELNIPVGTIKSYCRRNKASSPQIDDKHYCRYCGKAVEQTPGRKEKKFCSDACRMKWWNSNRDKVDHRALRKRNCLFCGSEFTAYSTSAKKYCSHSCYIASRFGGGSRE